MTHIDDMIIHLHAALTLFQECISEIDRNTYGRPLLPNSSYYSDQIMRARWANIAARDFVMRIHDFGEAVDASNLVFKEAFGDECMTERPSPKNLFLTYFPKIEKARHAAAHLISQTKSDKHIRSHAFKGDIDSVSLFSSGGYCGISTLGGSIVASWEGSLAEVPITLESLEKAEEVKLAVYRRIPNHFIVGN